MNIQGKYQQGDVVLYKVSEEDFDKARLYHRDKTHHRRAALAYGEETGHCHAIYMKDMLDNAEVTLCKSQTWSRDNEGLIVLNKPVQLKHEEHNTITLEPGYYLQRIVKEYDHISGITRGVID